MSCEKRRGMVLIAHFFLTFSPGLSLAKTVPEFTFKKIGISAAAGYVMPSESTYGNGLSLMAGFTYLFSKNIGAELSAGQFQSKVEKKSGGLSRGKLSIIPVELSLQGRLFLSQRVSAFAEAGGSYCLNKFILDSEIVNAWKNLNFTITEKTENSFGFHFGFGLDFFLTENLALNSGVRYRLAKSKGTWSLKDEFSSAEVSGNIEDIKLNSLVFGLKIKYYF